MGAYIRQHAGCRQDDESRQDALFDIYRVMRPGEPPTIDNLAEAMFNSLFFDAERYDLSAVGRVKDEHCVWSSMPRTPCACFAKEDILAVVKTLVELRDGKGDDRPTSTISATAVCVRSAN